jgi:putative aminopeptidase FrvX
MFDQLLQAAPGLQPALTHHPFLASTDTLWQALRSLLTAHAPSGGAALPGAILDQVTTIIHQLELTDYFVPHIGSTGNAGIWLGADKPGLDLLIIAHMDRPTFRVKSVTDGILYPMCAIRFPEGGYRVSAKLLRFENGKLDIGARGTLIFEHQGGKEVVRMETDSGRLAWYDTVVVEAEPTLTDGIIQGTGLDNCLGVITVLGAAFTLKQTGDALKAQNRRCLLVFSDQEEGLPDAYFGHSAARLTFAVPQPTYGCIVVDGQTVMPEGPLVMGNGAGHGTVSAWSRGAVVPPNYVRLAVDLSESVNQAQPNTVQMNTGYLSRSDDMPLGRWAQILGMIGPPMTDPHTGYERAQITDVQSAIRWLSYFAVATLSFDPAIRDKYALG